VRSNALDAGDERGAFSRQMTATAHVVGKAVLDGVAPVVTNLHLENALAAVEVRARADLEASGATAGGTEVAVPAFVSK